MTVLIVPQSVSDYHASVAAQFGEPEQNNRDSIPRVRIERDNVENANDELIVPAGSFSIDDPVAGKIYAKEISFRYYKHFYRYKRYDAHAERVTKNGDKATGKYIHSVLVAGMNDEAPSDDGSFQCGRPLGYIHDWKSLPESEQDFIKSCRQMVIFFGEATINGVDIEGNSVIETVPVEMELSNKTSGKTLVSFYQDIHSKKRTDPNSVSVVLKSKRVKGGVTFYDLVPSINSAENFVFDDNAISLTERFYNYVRGINSYVMERHRAAIDEDQKESDDQFFDINSEE